ncbi:TPA: hypothetical protein R4S57_004837 [Escherichia coli]|uniref:Uncharacterized protein n=1 Tax=Salmonella enterica TaxID=28901 RepID=A0A5T3SM93_SALER|nr:hypothetical protein [Salmonella enterica]HED1613589.1 hypothetical protein [Escherichia coli]
MLSQRENNMVTGKEKALYASGGLLAVLGGLLLFAAATTYKQNVATAPDLLDSLNYWQLTADCPVGEGAR